MSPTQFLRAVLVGGAIASASATASAQVGWMQPGVRLFVPRIAVDGSGPTSSNAEEAFLIDAVIGTSAPRGPARRAKATGDRRSRCRR